MKTLRLLLIACLCLAAQTQAQAQKTIYGAYLYSENGSMQPGIYSFTDTPDAGLTCVLVSGDLQPNGGAVYANGKYYAVSYFDMGFMTLAYMLVYDTGTFNLENTVMIEDWNVSYVTSDMTYDPSTGNIYACSLNADASGSFNLSLFDTQTGRQTPIAPVKRMCALAASADGTLYGIGADDGILYTIDKETAALTEVGPTGVTPENTQSATIDGDTGQMYWSAYTADGGALYTVDTATGKATHVFTYPDKAQIIGIYTLQAEHNEPAQPQDVSLDFEGGSLNGTLSFTMPTENADGKTLADEALNYELAIDINDKTAGTAAPGEKVKLPLQFDEAGSHMFSLTTSNAAGASEAVNITRYIGFDTPKAVTDVKISKEGEGQVTLTWTLPETGVNDGYIDYGNASYRIVRQPDNTVVDEDFTGTTFTETLTPEEKRICYYEVAATSAGKTGQATISNYVILGEHYIIPVDDDLTDWTLYPLYTSIDSNNDNATWIYSLEKGCIIYEWAFGDNNDDWFITPPMYMSKDKQYTVSASMRNDYEDIYSGTIEYAVGKESTAAAMQPVSDSFEVASSTFTEYPSKPFSVSEDGYYSVAIHITGEDSPYYVYIDRLKINEHIGSGITAPGADANGISISRNGGNVTIDNPDGLQLRVYNAAGQLVGEGSGTSISMSLSPGMYIARWADGALKFAM